jgi:pyrroline-5-carboxylate reductase
VKLGLIGCGFMGEAILKAAFARGVVAPDNVVAAELSDERRAAIAAEHKVRTTADPADVVQVSDLVVFAVKPQEFDRAARTLHGELGPEQTVVSIMAGVRIDTISRALSHIAVARVMPNTPAAIGEGVSVWTATPAVEAPARANVAALLAAMGTEIYVEDEKYLDMVTALSGSGPGFVYLLMEAFIDAGVHIGFRRDVAEKLALQTFAGSAKYAQARGDHLAQLRNEVTSPAGTTAAGLQILEEAGVRAAIVAAIEAAYERSRELGES